MTAEIRYLPFTKVIDNQDVSPVEINAGYFGENVVNILLSPEFFPEENPKFLEANSQLISQILQKVHGQITTNYHIVSRDLDYEAEIKKQAEIFINFIEKTFLALELDPIINLDYQNHDLFLAIEYLTGKYIYELREEDFLKKHRTFISQELREKYADPYVGYGGLVEHFLEECREHNICGEILDEAERDFRDTISLLGTSLGDNDETLALIYNTRMETYTEMQIAFQAIARTFELLITHEDWRVEISDDQALYLIGSLLEDFQESFSLKLQNLFIGERELGKK